MRSCASATLTPNSPPKRTARRRWKRRSGAATRTTSASSQLGGLYIIGTERHESRRIDNQLRGRSGRQGDPGESRFFVSLQDDLMRRMNADRVAGLLGRVGMDEDTPLESRTVTNLLEQAQSKVEALQLRHPQKRRRI